MATSEGTLKFFELYVAFAFIAAWVILELVAKRFDKPSQERENQPTPLAKHEDEKPQIKRSLY